MKSPKQVRRNGKSVAPKLQYKRPVKSSPKVWLKLWLPNAAIRDLDAYCAKLGCTRGHLVEIAVAAKAGLEIPHDTIREIIYNLPDNLGDRIARLTALAGAVPNTHPLHAAIVRLGGLHVDCVRGENELSGL